MGLLSGLLDRFLGLPEATTPDIEITHDLSIPMPDGVVLLADRYRPRGAGPLPVVLVRTPYGKHKFDVKGTARVLARRGMQVVVQNVRGTFGSGGRFAAFHQEREDGLATAAWLRGQAWCDGRLATAGASYLGYTQWAVGPYLDPPLEAMCLGVTASEFTTTFYPGGVLSLHNMLTWSALIGTQEEARLGGLLPDPRQARRLRRAMAHVPIETSDLAAIGKAVPFLREVAAHAEPGDGFWSDTENSAVVAKMTTPVSMVTGWWDLFLPAQLRDFVALQGSAVDWGKSTGAMEEGGGDAPTRATEEDGAGVATRAAEGSGASAAVEGGGATSQAAEEGSASTPAGVAGEGGGSVVARAANEGSASVVARAADEGSANVAARAAGGSGVIEAGGAIEVVGAGGGWVGQGALRGLGARRARIVIGPWGHDLGAIRAVLVDQVSWLSAQLLGDTAQLHRSPVRLYLQRANRWLDFDAWPPPQSAPTPLYLLPQRRLGWDAPGGAGSPDTFTYDPARPTRSVGGPLLDMRESKQRDNRDIEARPDVLVYTGAPLPRHLDLVGPVSATVHVRTDTGHADLFVRLCDVDASGVSRNVTDGILRLPPGSEGVVRAEIELHPTGYRFMRGHRLRVQVAGGAFPRFARNHGTGEPVGQAVRTRPTRFEIFLDGSSLTLPVLGAP
ncbi:CocE/NonD family hydrolase [Nonomuraea sp. NPDC050451]|uniref:CocE/NonD family hydrolase n=1 Tax=Nonomuraea sp. NPDC050451 TaxID=3364364 RepID=UPI0037AF67A3